MLYSFVTQCWLHVSDNENVDENLENHEMDLNLRPSCSASNAGQ